MPTYFGPGRVNVIGEHTDHAGGLALPVAIDRGITLEVTARGDRTHLTSKGFDDLDLAPMQMSTTGWGRYVLAVANELARAGTPVRGLEGRLRSDLPVGAGLSSSAALEVAVALAFLEGGDRRLDDEQLIRLCRDAEELAVGVPCGLLDQAASNTGLPAKTGDGSAAISGYAVSAVHFQLDPADPQNIDSVTFTLDSPPELGSTVKIHLPSSGGTWFSCFMAGSPAVNASCQTTGVTVSQSDQLDIVVAD